MSKVKEPKRVCIKASPKENLTHKIDIATQTLERNIGFINSCDTKTSIVLTSIGVLLTIILTNDGLSAIFGIISSCGSGKTFCDILYLGGFLVSVGMLVIGMWKLVTVLIAKIEPSKKDSNPTTGPSMIFFGGILKVGNRAVYRNKFFAMTDREYLDDLIAEIYEPMIKINFGNYSAQDALNSLIGSPRGYIGSNKGELPDKLMRSRSKVILIDEFEKASKPVYNFFLQLLEEGKFTDSLGREYDLNKYIIVFTSNMPKEKIGEYLPPELRSRFSYKCAFWPLSTKDKEEYVVFKSNHYLNQIKQECPGIDHNLKASDIVNLDVSLYSNMRDINNEIMRQLTDSLYTQIVQ